MNAQESKKLIREMERELKKEKLLNEAPCGLLGLDQDSAETFSGFDIKHDLSIPNSMLVSLDDLIHFFYRFTHDQNFSKIAQNYEEHSPICTSSHHYGNRPHDLKHSILIDLYQRGHFSEDEIHLKVAAYFIIKGLTAEQAIAELSPTFPFKKFHVLQAKVHSAVEKHTPKYATRFLKYFEKLTKPQKEALRLVDFENEDKKTRIEIAKKLGISVHSLYDRREGALKKLKAEFSELIPTKERVKPGYFTELLKPQDLREQGFYRRSEATKIRPVYRIHPTQKSKTRVPAIKKPRLRGGTLKEGVAAKKEWERITSYRPTHDGVSSPLLAHMTNVYSNDLKKNVRASGRVYEETESQVIEKRKIPQSESGKKNQEKAIVRANERDQWKVAFDKYKE